MRFHVSFVRALLVCLAGALLLPAARGQAYIETEKKHGWFSFSKPAKENPADQMVHAEELLAARKLRQAGKAFRSLSITWPSSPEAPMAQWAYARILDSRGKKEAAFDAYQELMEKNAGRFPDYDKVLLRQFEIAKWLMEKKRATLFFGGFEAPEKAIPLFESIIKNGPRAPFADEAQYLIGSAYERSFEYELAVVAYSATLHRYPLSPFAEQASFGRARALTAISDDYPNNPQAMEEAWAGVMAFMRSFPGSSLAGEASGMRDRLLNRRARSEYEVARFYDKVAKRPQVALESYREFVQLYPRTDWTEPARERIEALAALPASDAKETKADE